MVYKVPRIRERSPLAEQMRGLGKDQLEIAMWNVHTIQLTYGCSVGCYFCGCNVPKGVIAHIPVEIVDFLAENFQPQFILNKPYLSGNNEPLDWESRGKDYRYAYRALTDNGRWPAGASTAVPRGKEGIALDCIVNGYVSRISVSTMNKRRLRKEIPEIFKLARENDADLYYPEKHLITMGRLSNGEYEADSLSNRLGTMISPLGIVNINLTHPSKRFPTGEIETLIDPNRFSVIEWGRRKDLPIEIWDYWIYGRNGAFPVHVLEQEDVEIVDRRISNSHLFLKMFCHMNVPMGKETQDLYLDAARRATRRTLRGLEAIEPANEASYERLKHCTRYSKTVIGILKNRDDFWSRRKRVLIEESMN